MTTATQTVAEFLLARIAEDEAVARKAGKQKVAGPLIRWHAESAFLRSSDMFDQSERAHIARHDPACVLAECEAKRAILDRFERHLDDADYDIEWVVWLLAQPYADHPDFNAADWDPDRPDDFG